MLDPMVVRMEVGHKNWGGSGEMVYGEKMMFTRVELVKMPAKKRKKKKKQNK